MLFKKVVICLIIQLCFTAGESFRGFDYIKNAAYEGLEILKSSFGESKTNKTEHFKLESGLFQEALQELCPFPGFSGSFCPGNVMPQFKEQSSGIPAMPAGIGASFDIATGELKLPSVQLTYQQNPEQIYTDPHTGRQFTVADETNVQYVELGDETRIFRDELELARFWLDASERGQWFGGQYSAFKEITELYERYFNGDQYTSVSQYTRNVARLTFKSDNLALNKHAQRAVDSLPQDFVEEIYNEFMAAWGTHVAVDTFIGGMGEKLSVFKNCVEGSGAFSGGLSEGQIYQALNNDLHGNLGDAFFEARRRVSIDHRLGGNPEDVPNWEQTISQNPALLRINRFLSWDAFVADPQIKANLQRAIYNRVQSVKQRSIAIYQQLQEQKRNQRIGPQTAFAIIGLQRLAIVNSFGMQHAYECPPGLGFEDTRYKCRSQSLPPLDIFNMDTQYLSVRYERDDQGRFRTVYTNRFFEVERDGNEYYGEWVFKGCSIAQHPNVPYYGGLDAEMPAQGLPRIICSGCNPELITGNRMACSCPGF